MLFLRHKTVETVSELSSLFGKGGGGGSYSYFESEEHRLHAIGGVRLPAQPHCSYKEGSAGLVTLQGASIVN